MCVLHLRTFSAPLNPPDEVEGVYLLLVWASSVHIHVSCLIPQWAEEGLINKLNATVCDRAECSGFISALVFWIIIPTISFGATLFLRIAQLNSFFFHIFSEQTATVLLSSWLIFALPSVWKLINTGPLVRQDLKPETHAWKNNIIEQTHELRCFNWVCLMRAWFERDM